MGCISLAGLQRRSQATAAQLTLQQGCEATETSLTMRCSSGCRAQLTVIASKSEASCLDMRVCLTTYTRILSLRGTLATTMEMCITMVITRPGEVCLEEEVHEESR